MRFKNVERNKKEPTVRNNNNDNNNNDDHINNNLFPSPSGPYIPPLPPPRPLDAFGPLPLDPFRPPPLGGFNLPLLPPFFANNAITFHISAQSSSFNRPRTSGSSSNLYGSQTATLTREREGEQNIFDDQVQEQLGDTINELPDHLTLELGDELIDNLGVEANGLLDSGFITKQEEEDAVIENIKEDYNLTILRMLLRRELSMKVLIFSMGETMEILFVLLSFYVLILTTENS